MYIRPIILFYSILFYSISFHSIPFHLFDVIIKRRRTVWVFLSCADIHISICIRAILRRPSSCPKPSSYTRNFIAKNHYVVVIGVSFREFFTPGVVMFDGMKMRWCDLLVCVPGFDGVSPVFSRTDSGGGGGGGGS
jgi:hypothetical protein